VPQYDRARAVREHEGKQQFGEARFGAAVAGLEQQRHQREACDCERTLPLGDAERAQWLAHCEQQQHPQQREQYAAAAFAEPQRELLQQDRL
jgi:hypothetical protein